MLLKEKLISILMFSGFMLGGCADEPYTVEIGGINVKERQTNKEGQAYFVDDDTSKKIKITVLGLKAGLANNSQLNDEENRFTVSEAEVLFFDGIDFSGYHLHHNDYDSLMQIPLNSGLHKYVLISLPFGKYDHNSDKNELSKIAADNFFYWAKKSWRDEGCYSKDKMIDDVSPGTFIIEENDLISTLSFRDEDNLLKQMYFNSTIPETAYSRVYTLKPSDYGFQTDSALYLIDVRYNSLEDCINKD